MDPNLMDPDFTPVRLYVYTAMGCPACEAAMAPFAAVCRESPELMALTRDVQFAPKSVKVTPSYVLVRGDQIVAQHDGMMQKRQLTKWLDAHLAADSDEEEEEEYSDDEADDYEDEDESEDEENLEGED